MNTDKLRTWAPLILRIGISLVFLWFGWQQLFHTASWTGLIPVWATNLSGLSATFLVLFNASFEIVFGLCLLFGVFTRITALLLALHLAMIMFDIGFNDVGVRDFGLLCATIAIFLYGTDMYLKNIS